MGRITKCGCYLVVPGFFSHERHTGGLRWWAMGRRLPSFTGFSKPSSCVESGTEHLAKGNGVVSFWLTNLIAAWPRRNLEPGRSIATIFVGLLFFFFRKMVPIQFSRHATLTARYAFFFCWFCLFVCVLFSFDQGRHTKTGQLAAIKVMDVTEVKQQKKNPKKRETDRYVATFLFQLEQIPKRPIPSMAILFSLNRTRRRRSSWRSTSWRRYAIYRFFFWTHDLPKSTFYLVFTGFFFDDWFAVGFVVVFERSLECLPSFTEFLFCSNGWKSFDSVLPSFSLSLIVSTGFFLPSFPWNLHLESVMDLVTF